MQKLVITACLGLFLSACQNLPSPPNGSSISHTKSIISDSQYQHIRNVTAKINYAGKTFLIDPYLAQKGRYLPPNAKVANPTVELPLGIDDILAGVDALIVTHTHPDHWDMAAQESIPKDLPIFVQNAGDAKTLRSQGFTNVKVLGVGTVFGDIKLTKTGGQHGTDEMYANPKIAEMVDEAMGVVFEAKDRPTVYLAGDTIWNYEVEHALTTYRPDFIVLNAGYAKIPNFEGGPIMGYEDVAKAHAFTQNQHNPAKIITVHMDALPQTTITSEQMREFVKKHNLNRVYVPKMGEVIQF